MLYEIYDTYTESVERLVVIAYSKKKIDINQKLSFLGSFKNVNTEWNTKIDSIYRAIVKKYPDLYIKKENDKYIVTFAPKETIEDRKLMLNIS